ncbi:unnamed protein product [Angiostrongylus costaricensis]|uniref:RNA_GG_bind domain-containing protein n=1 Tax=Angiostrongylus costaricensis TaxID=334426 RepID=A0A158PG08_ANGCS|nr:unnamed protein product [Angiostrongylus costaricensis]
MSSSEGSDGGDGDDGDSRTLADDFKKAEEVINDITDGHFSSADLQSRIEGVIQTLENLTRSVSKLDLFSDNEQVYYTDFLRRLQCYGFKIGWSLLLQEDEEGCSDEANLRKKKFTGEELREQKIARFRKQKELKAIIEQLRGQLDLNKTDESVQRALHLAVLRYWSQKVLEELESIEGELPLVEMMQKRMQASSEEKGASVVDKKPSINSSLLVSDGNSAGLRPFIITRSTQQKSVFGLGYPSIPTMTVDEWYNQRFGSTSIPSQKEQKTCPTSNAEDACSSECYQEENDEQARARSMIWDDYKDYHRRGWGNTHNKDSDSDHDYDLPVNAGESSDVEKEEDNGPVAKRVARLWLDALMEQNLFQKGSSMALDKPDENKISRGVESYYISKTVVRSEYNDSASLSGPVASATSDDPFGDSAIDLSAETAFCERLPEQDYCCSSKTTASSSFKRGGFREPSGSGRVPRMCGTSHNVCRGRSTNSGLKRSWQGKVADRSHLLSPSYSLETLMAVEFATDISIEQLGDEIAKALGERNPKPIRPIVVACGIDKAISLFEETRKIECSGGMMEKILAESREEGRKIMRARRKGRFNFSENVAKLAELLKKEREKDSASDFLKPLPPAEVLYRQDLVPGADKRVSNDEKNEDTQMEP